MSERSTGWSTETVTVPASTSTLTAPTPGTALTSVVTALRQWSQAMPSTWKAVVPMKVGLVLGVMWFSWVRVVRAMSGLGTCSGSLRPLSGRCRPSLVGPLVAPSRVHARQQNLVEPRVGGEQLVQGEQVVAGQGCPGLRVLGVRRQGFGGGVVEEGDARSHQGEQGPPVESRGDQVGAAVAGPGDSPGRVGLVRGVHLGVGEPSAGLVVDGDGDEQRVD